MRFGVLCPIPASGAFAENIAGFARAVEAAGFDAIAFTEHPAPSAKWLAAGGHPTLDPYVALAFCAAVTTRLRLLTWLSVLPYRNPLLTARAAFSLDVLSSGRAILTCGVGYLRSEFAALGVDFDSRGDLFDDALAALSAVWSRPAEFTYSGRSFLAQEQTLCPGPIQAQPPLWIGGNSVAARQRVVQHGVGWAPLLGGPEMAATTRTTAISTTQELSAGIADLRERLGANGRDPGSVDVCVQAADKPFEFGTAAQWETDEQLEWLEQLHDAGANWTILAIPPQEASATFDFLARYGEEVIQRIEPMGGR